MLALAGCGGALQADARRAAAGALDAVTTDRAEIAATVASATAAAREEAIGPAAQAEVRAAVAAADAQVIADARALRTELASALRLSVDESLSARTRSEVAALREELVGAPLRADVDALVDQAAPHLASALQAAVRPALADLTGDLRAQVQAIKADADAEAVRWRPVAVTFAVGAALLALALGFAVLLVRRHRRTIATLSRALHERG